MTASQPETIVAILFRRVGDSLLATPALRAMKKRYPDHRLAVIAEPQVARVFECNPWIDEVIIAPKSPSPTALAALMRTWGSPAIALDFLSDPRSALAAFLSRAKLRIGFAYGLRSVLYHRTVALQNPLAPVYSAEHKLKLAEAAGAAADSPETEFYVTEAELQRAERRIDDLLADTSKQLICIFPYSRRDYKRWPAEGYAALCEALNTSTTLLPVLLSGPGERDYCEQIRRRAQLTEDRLQLFDDLGEMAAFIAECALYVGNDGGPKHLAVATGVQTVTIFLNDPPEYWTPPDHSNHIALAADSTCPEITPDTVLRAVESLGISV